MVMDKEKKKMIIFLVVIFLFSLIVNSFYLIGAFPGNMTLDSVAQFSQLANNQYTNYHPAFSTILYKIPTLIYFSPASIIFMQILMFSAVITYTTYSLYKNTKINKIFIFIVMICFSMFITNGFMLSNMWKDVPYSICVMLLTTCCLNIVSTNGEWLSKKSNTILLIATMSFVSLIRHNGIIVAILTTLALMIFMRGNFKKKLLILIATFIVYIGVNGALTTLLKVEDTMSMADIVSIPLQQIAAVIKNNGKLTKEQEEILYEIAPKEEWQEKYNKYLSDNIKNLANEKFKEDSSYRTEIIKIYPSICINNFKTVVKAYLEQTSIIWSLGKYDTGALTFYTLEPNEFGFAKRIISPIHTLAYRELLMTTTRISFVKFIVWNPAILMYLSIIFLIIDIIRRKKISTIIISIPMFANILGLLISIPAQDYRYLYANLLCTCIIFIYCIRKNN